MNNIPHFNFGFLSANSGKKRKLQKPFRIWKILRGDKVVVIKGKDKGKTGQVIRVYRKSNRVKVSGVNIRYAQIKGDPDGQKKGGLKPVLHPFHMSNVMLIDPEQGKRTRIRFGFLEDGRKVRISVKSGAIIEKPKLPGCSPKERNKNKIDGPKDTSTQKVLQVTYQGEDFASIKAEFDKFIARKEKRESLLVFDE